MKKQVSAFINSFGLTTAYSGKSRTMYITNWNIENYDIEEKVISKFGYGLNFKLQTNSF